MILKIFDFDGSLIDSLTPEVGIPMYEAKKGVPYPAKGWWGRKESLDSTVLDIKPIEVVAERYRYYITNDAEDLFLVTGRLKHLEKQVKHILDENNFKFTKVITNNTNLPTEKYKLKVFEELLSQKKYDEIHIYEDREKHIDLFIEFFKSKKIPFIFNKVANVDGEFKVEVTKYGI